MDAVELAKIFREMAAAEDFIGDIPFKSRTYRLAAEAVEKVGLNLEKLKETKGIGKAVINKTKEYLESGRVKKHTELMELIPVRYKKKILTQDAKNLGKRWREEVKRRFFNEDGSLKTWPSKHSAKFYTLKEIARNFKKNRVYTENEVNAILAPIHEDHIALRRYLVNYGFVKRTKDGSEYKRGF